MFAGILLSVMASCVFGVLSYYSVLLLPLNGFGIVAWRVVFTTGMLLLVMSLGRFWPLFIAQFRSLLQQKHGLLMAIGGMPYGMKHPLRRTLCLGFPASRFQQASECLALAHPRAHIF